MGTETASADAAIVPEAGAIEKQGKYYLLFFISGFPALIYQIVWQRALFTIYGVNIESVTVIVTVFMLGLGIGSLVGGRISVSPGVRALQCFGLIELCIGIFGALSLHIFHLASALTAGASTWVTGVASFVLLLLPTLLMGSTLPLLVSHLVRTSANVGKSVGSLYAANTLGSSIACLLAAVVFMRLLGQSGSIILAAGLNFLVGGTALVLSRKTSMYPPQIFRHSGTLALSSRTIPIQLGMFLAGASGFIALAYEVLWYRVFSFASGSIASCFAKLLAFYLFGVAYSAFAVHDACKAKLKENTRATLDAFSKTLFLGAIVAFLLGPALAAAVSFEHISYEITFPLVAIGAGLLGAGFPLVCHAVVDPSAASGKEMSYLYLANILGSVLGSFTIGFVVFDHFSIAETSFFLLALGLIVSVVIAILAHTPRTKIFIGAVSILFLISLACHGLLFGHFYERLLFKSSSERNVAFANLVENRSGVIAVSAREVVYGGGAYDGHFNIDPAPDVNGIFRAYAIPAIHPNPKRVLIIGLSSGSWAQILSNDPQVEDVTIAEINPGYLPLIRQRPEVSGLLINPKVHIVIDDGRRWLVSHPDRQFDFILMNTTFNWRANISNLLSVEFLQLVRQRLNAGGVLYYNTTDSGEVLRTGASMYPFALRIGNFLAVSDTPILFDRNRLQRVLQNYRIDGRLAFDPRNPAAASALQQLVSLPQTKFEDRSRGISQSIEDRSSLLSRLKDYRIITDDNMGTEWQ